MATNVINGLNVTQSLKKKKNSNIVSQGSPQAYTVYIA